VTVVEIVAYEEKMPLLVDPLYSLDDLAVLLDRVFRDHNVSDSYFDVRIDQDDFPVS